MGIFFSHSLFGSKHIILLVISVVVIILSLLLIRKLELKTVNKLMFYLGLPCEVIKVFYYIIINEEKMGGYLPKTDLPFHLCSIQIIFFAILCFSQSDKIKRILYSFMIPSCLFGGFAALLLPTDSARHWLWLLTFEYFLFHVAIVVFALYLLTSKKIKLEIKDYFMAGGNGVAMRIIPHIFKNEENIEKKHVGKLNGSEKELFLIGEAYPGVWLEHVYDSVMYAKLTRSSVTLK